MLSGTRKLRAACAAVCLAVGVSVAAMVSAQGSADTSGRRGVAAGAQADSVDRLVGVLRAGDILKIHVYRDSELSGEHLIDSRGNVQIPGLGVIRAAGLDPTQVTERLVEALRSRGFSNPELSVQPLIRVSVLGEVRSPALYSVEPGTSLIQLLTRAGGPADRADLSRTRVVRGGRAFLVDLQSGLQGSAAGRVVLYSNDVVVVPQRRGVFTRENLSFVLSGASVLLSIINVVVASRR